MTYMDGLEAGDSAEIRAATDWSALVRRHLWMGNMRRDQIEYHGPLVLDKAEGIYLSKADGTRVIDAMAGAWVVNAGHGRTAIVEAIARQAQRLPLILNEGYTNSTTVALAERLLALVPGTYDRVFFTSGGSEAVETALKMVRQRWAVRGTPRYKVIGRELSYHGATWGALSVTGFPEWRWPFAPPVPGASFIPHPTCIRCPLGLSYSSCGVACAHMLRDTLEKAGPEKVGAVIAEPISAASSAHVPPDEYWPLIRSICDEYGVMLIADEIVTGFGRTGEWFGLQHWGVEPDILVLGKGMTSGYVPLAAVLTRADITEDLDEDGFVHGYTFSGHPVACAAAMANLDILEREELPENARRQGERLTRMLTEGLANCSILGDIRGKGLLLTIELVRDRATMDRFADPFAFAALCKPIFMRHRVLCRVGPQIRLGPPLSITDAETDVLGESLIAAILEVERSVVDGGMGQPQWTQAHDDPLAANA
ncbi:aspartate aminotransferase family protein [Actinomyces qiguomingii]|uniref:aminotransferase family protein n=1 Tax=Actinomyces qiguomingii TaxID=2057800 RepID=UPI000CA058FC|nr:aspartate aminotransferase family protein [Actinomyces qiguomingii]